MLIPKEKYEDTDKIKIEIRPGVGGSESTLFAQDIMEML